MSYYAPLSRRLSEYAASYLSPYLKLDDENTAASDAEGKFNTQSSLSVGLWSGSVKLKCVELRPDAIENFLNSEKNSTTRASDDANANDPDSNTYVGAKVRWKLLRGSIDSVDIQIPWKSLLVGSSHSSLKRSSDKNSRCTLSSISETEGCGRYVDADCEHIDQNKVEEGSETFSDGFTTVDIDGVKLQIGYEIIYKDPLLDTLKLQRSHKMHEGDDHNLPRPDDGSDVPLDDVQKKIREERNRILQIAERRLLAGLDPFPPSLVANLQSIVASSIQSGIKSASEISSSDNAHSTNRQDTYLSRMEAYVSSTIRNIVWRTFDSLSLSITHVHLSMVGCSHYEKNVEATLRKTISERKRQENEKELTSAQKQNVLMHQRSFQQRWLPNDDGHHPGSRLKTPRMHNLHKRIRHDSSFSLLHRAEYLVPREFDIEGNSTQQAERKEKAEMGDASWAEEGEIEIGFLIDRFDVRPASLSEKTLDTESFPIEDSNAANDQGASALKHFRVSNFGAFLRRSCKKTGGDADEPSFWIDLNNEDFILDPTNIEATARFYRSNSVDSEMNMTGMTSSSFKQRKIWRGQSSTVNTEMTSESIGTPGSNRRGKRDKKPKGHLSQTYVLRKRSRRLEVSIQFGHVRSSLSPRQLFLLDSVCSSMDRMKRGRPSTTIRRAKAYDKLLIERTTEEGQPLIDWDERIIKAIPSLRSSRNVESPRTLPNVISSWWKYAYINVVQENHKRKLLLDRCCDADGQMKRSESIKLHLKSRSALDWEEQRRIRRDYIELYLIAHTSTIGKGTDHNQWAVTAAAAAEAAKIRLEELEDQLSIERVLLLKYVARAASIRKNDFESQSNGSKPGDSSVHIGEFFYFPPKYPENAGCLGGTRQSGSFTSNGKRMSTEYLTLSDPIHPADQTTARRVGKTTPSDTIAHLQLPRSSKTFFVVVKVSGFSLALCNFGEDDGSRESEEKEFNFPDDISALSGLTDLDDSSHNRIQNRIKVPLMPDERRPADSYVPNCRFWLNSRRGLCYEPIMLMHVVDMSVSGQNVGGDHLRVECEFSVGGIDLVTCASPFSLKRIISLGKVPTDETTNEWISPAPQIKASETGIHGIASFASGDDRGLASSVMANVCPTSFIVDWSGLEKFVAFVTESKDVAKENVLMPFAEEALLRSALSTNNRENKLSITLDCDKLSLAIPTVEHANDTEGKYLIINVDSLSLKTGYSSASADEKESVKTLPETPFLNERSKDGGLGMLVAVNNLSVSISTGGFDPPDIESNGTALLQCPVNIQFHQLSKGCVEMAYNGYGSKTEITSLSPIKVLVSDFRLQVLSKLVATCSRYFLKVSDVREGNNLPRPTLSAITDSVLTATKVSIPSLVICLVPDGERNCTTTYNQFVRNQLEDILTNFLSQLSCLDYEHPSIISSECMTNLCLGRCCAIGLSIQDAKIIVGIAESHFKNDLLVAMRNWNKRTLTERIDSVIANATKKAVTKFDATQRIHCYPDCNFVVRANSLTINQSRFYLGSLIECTAGEISVQNENTRLLHIAPSDGADVALLESSEIAATISVRSSHDETICRDIYFELSHLDVVFLADAYIDTIETLQSAAHFWAGIKMDSNNDLPDEAVTSFKDLRLNGSASSTSILLTDKFIPFLRCRFRDISVETVGPSNPLPKMTLLAGFVALECVSPSGAETYPNIIMAYESSCESGLGPPALSIQVTSAQTSTSFEQTKVSVCFNGVRVLVLYQFICECAQFFSSPKYGFGLLSHYVRKVDENGKGTNTSSATSKLEIVFRNSSVVLPRQSTCVDLLGIEVEELSIAPDKVKESWSIDEYSFSKCSFLDRDDPSSSSSSEGFFDCMEEMHSYLMSLSSNAVRNAEERHISRLTVQIRQARIFTALHKQRKQVSIIHLPLWNANVVNTGRIQSEKRAFRACGEVDDSIAGEIDCRLWEEITTEPLSLGLTTDWAPTLRLLIENTDYGGLSGAAFDMRMSQFHLLMAIWYNNMQELPLMFPYEDEEIDVLSTDPQPPLDWPEYGTNEFIERIKHGSARNTYEMAICLSSMTWRCSFDQANYFGEGADPPTLLIMQNLYGLKKQNAIDVELGNVICSIKETEDTLFCIGLGATSLKILDQRYTDKSLLQGLRTKHSHPRETSVDPNWGLDCGRHTLVDGLPLPVQATVFMTPDHYCMINLGIDMAEAALSDLGVIWILHDYFGLYFKLPDYGHPVFAAEKMVENHSMGIASQAPCRSLDFRLFLTDPHVVIPSCFEADAKCLMLEGAGLHYRYKSFGLHFSSQDIVANNLGIVVLSKFMEPDLCRGLRQVSGSLLSSGAKTLVDRLSFSVKYDYDDSTKFTRFAVSVPLSSQHFSRNAMDGIEPSDVDVKPFLVPPPLICIPLITPSRNLGEHETKVYFSYEYMKLAVDLLIAFIGPSLSNHDKMDCAIEESFVSSENIFSVNASLESIKFFVSDPVMGMHRPFFSVSISSILLTASRLKDIERSKNKYHKLLGRGCNVVASNTLNDKDLQVCVETAVFVDYFKLGMTRNWEPLIEPFRCLIMYEQSTIRGKGYIFNADCPLHLNITGASIETIDDAIATFGAFSSDCDFPTQSLPNRSQKTIAETVTRDESGHKVSVFHKLPESLNEQERIAFSLKNFSGQRIRVHIQSDLEAELSSSKTTVTYLDHNRLMPVSFPATETVIKNLEPVEVPFEGDQNITAHHKQLTVPRNHSIDVQIPGFRWACNISLDKMGKHFIELIPRSPFVQAKADADWRWKNALNILAEVTSVNGGRRLCIMSPFEVVNKTDHSIFVLMHPDPRHLPQCDILESKQDDSQTTTNYNKNGAEKLDPDGSYNIPYLLLESAMHLEGNHLGSIWIRPDQLCAEVGEISRAAKESNFQLSSNTDIVGYPPRPIQLAKILHESSLIFRDSDGDPMLANQVASGAEISCPIFDENKKRKSIPFCYVVEVKRSPLVSSETSENGVTDASALSPPMTGKRLRGARIMFSRNTSQSRAATIHAPVAYSLVIHPPIVIENLLPERGRFELMNATSRAVLWWGTLEPGERFPIHTVGLDAPLLLLMNLGYCRTPVGEGALIHDGGGNGFWLKTGWKNVGNAIIDTQDKVKKTLSTITKSKDNRGAERVTKLRQQKQIRDVSRRRLTNVRNSTALKDDEDDAAMDENVLASKARLRDTFSLEDIASETIVVDSVGQRLTLHLDNVLGNGGQRHVTIYSPFWIVNTTEHSLRYKQEKALSYVSGTVLGPGKDGSKPVDRSNRNDTDDDTVDVDTARSGAGFDLLKFKTVFPGTHGVLKELEMLGNSASKPAILAALISEDLPLSITSKLAIMFNFQEVLSLGGAPRLCIQLADATNRSHYTSAWSSGFGLESVGVTQIVGMLCKDGRGLEVSVSISVAPGRLSNYTKIVRICPRYVIVNQLPQPVRLWQDNSLSHPNQVSQRSDVTFDSRKWIFVDGIEPGVINQYEPLFGAPTVIDSSDERGIPAESTAHHNACYIATIRPFALTAFHLPDTRLERLLRVELGFGWNLSSSFPADTAGQYVLSMGRTKDIQTLPHGSTRAAPIFNVVLPPRDGKWNGELGVWFETDWGKDRSLIVKGTKEGSYASYFTDIVVGDELVLIDDVHITQFTFDEAMKHLKARLSYAQELKEREANQPQQHRLSLQRKKKAKRLNTGSSATREYVTLTFITLEERMRRLRSSAVSSKGTNIDLEHINAGMIEESIVPGRLDLPQESSKEIFVDMNFLYQTIFINLQEPDLTDPPHKIINRSSRWNIYYRQRACDSHPWKCLSPGESAAYTWEEPLQPKKLSVRVGVGEWNETVFGKDNRGSTGVHETRQRRPLFSFHFIENEEQGHFGATKTVKMEEIGYMDRLPYPAKGDGGKNSNDGLESGLHCHVDTEGATRVLIVSDEATTQSLGGDKCLILSHLQNIKRELREEYKRKAKIAELDELLQDYDKKMNIDDLDEVFASDTPKSGGDTDNAFVTSDASSSCLCTSVHLASKLNNIVDYDEDMFITKCNQVIVEVLEATGLQSANLSGLSNPYCQVSLIEDRKNTSRSYSFSSKVQSRSTYFVEKTVSPQWSRQAFVFDVPSKAVNNPSRFSIHCVMKSEENLLPNKFLGQAYVHLRNLKDQHLCDGWYPLMGKVGKNEDSVDRIRSAIRLRVQWVYDYEGLLKYYSECSDRRINTLARSKAGMKRQLKTLEADEKQKRERGESLFLTKVPALAATMYGKRKSLSMEHDEEKRSSQDSQSRGLIKGVTSGVKSALVQVQFRLSKQDPAQNNNFLDDSEKDALGNVLDEINEEYLSDGSDDQLDTLEQNQSLGGGTKSPPKQLPIGIIKERVCNDDPLDITASNLDAPISLLKPHLSSDRARFEYLRECKRENIIKTNGTPIFASLNLSRAFVNARVGDTTTTKTKPLTLSSTSLENDNDDNYKFQHIIDHLRLPPESPSAFSKRGYVHVRDLMHSRISFSKAARRSLRSVLNPGGVLTIRPITALNLPETYTGMFVKLRYGNKILCTNIVDSKVVPVWSVEETPNVTNPDNDHEYSQERDRSGFVKQRSYSQSTNDPNEVAEYLAPTRFWGVSKQNDLVLNVDPFEISKSIRLTVIGEKLQSKEEIGVLDIPLGKALECCSQSMEDFHESLNEGNPWDQTPAYIRWFPLMSSALAVPVEGDMGQSTRSSESEKVKDNMFEEYFAPCIKLALLFEPNHQRTNGDFVEVADAETLSTVSMYVCARIDRISAAVIDSSRFNELLSFSSRDVDVRISMTKAKTRTSFAVGNVQIDQQSSNFRSKAPVIFAPTPTKHPHPTVQFLCWKDNDRSKSDMESYDYVAFQLQEMDLKMEETWLFEVWEFYFHVVKKREARLLAREKIVHGKTSRGFGHDGDDFERVITNAAAFLKVDRESRRLKKIYVRELILGYTKINLSYFKSSRSNLTSSDVTLEDIPLGFQNQVGLDAFQHWSEEIDGDLDERTHFAHVNMISAVFPSISDAPIKFQGKLIEHVYEFEGDILKYLQSFYASEALKQIYKIVGSLDFVGNPTMVVSSFSTGLRDFVLQPSRELKHLTKNPSRFGVGVLRGTLSLVSNSSSGVFGFFSNLGSTVGHTAAMLTLDKQFQTLHSEQQAAQQRNYDRWKKRGFGRVTLFVTRPIHDVVFGLVSASTGVLTEPYRGAKKDGVTGFLKGTAVGVIGVVVKPIVGLSDAFAHVMESVHDLAKDINVLEGKFRPNERYRLPYVFGVERILVPFNQVDSISAALLRSHPIEKRSDVKGNEVLVTSEALHISSGLDQFIIVTTRRVVLFKVKVIDGQGFVTVNLVWQALLGERARVTSSLGDMGHHRSILCISRYSSEDSSSKLHLETDESEQIDTNAISLPNRSSKMMHPRPETPRQSLVVPFRLRAWPFGATEGVTVNRFVIEGEFKQRQNLLRVHNAICCLSGDLDSTIDEGYTDNRGEGVTVFGPLLFEYQSNSPPTANVANLYNSLEHTAWEAHETTPSWLDEGHILLTSVSPPATSLAYKEEEFLSKTVDDKTYHNITSFSADLTPGNPDHDSLLGDTPFDLNDLFGNNETWFENEQSTEELAAKSISEHAEEEEHRRMSRTNKILNSHNIPLICEHDILAEGNERDRSGVGSSLDAISLHSWTSSLSPTRQHSPKPEASGLDERLSRVEALLELLAPPEAKPIDDSLINIGSTSSSTRTLINRDVEVKNLQREILSLKQQLTAVKSPAVIEGQESVLQPKRKANRIKLFRGKKGGNV